MATLKKLAEELNFQMNGRKLAYGTFRGFTITFEQHISYTNSQDIYKVIYIPCDFISDKQRDYLQVYFSDRKKELPNFQFFYSEQLVEVHMYEVFKTLNKEKLTLALNTIIDGLTKAEVSPLSKCVFCGEEGPNSTTKINNILLPAHDLCLEKAKAEQGAASAEYEQQENRYLEGTFGAIIGALIGSIPWILVSMFTNFYAGILAVVIGYSAYFFYKKFGGKVTSKTKIIITFVTLLGILFTNFFLASYVIIVNDGVLVYDNYVLVYTDPIIGPLLLQDLGLGLLIGSFGLYSVYKRVQIDEKRVSIK